MIGKTSLIAAVRARLPELTTARAAAVVDALFAAITEILARGTCKSGRFWAFAP